MAGMLLHTCIALVFLKVLLFDAYYSTDFEVHRNWMAITYNLPLSQWYIEHTSQWTLDYPPFFAYFEWVLAHLCPQQVIDDGALEIRELGEFGWKTIFYQRSTVIISELLLFVALYYYIQSTKPGIEQSRARAVAQSLVLSPGLLIIDHIHFQYNGFLFGILTLSLVAIIRDKPILSAFAFSVLLCFKHIYLYMAPAYFFYLLRVVVFKLDTRNTAERSEQPENKVSDRKHSDKKSFDKKISDRKVSESNPSKSILSSTLSLIDWNQSIKLGLAVLIPFIVAFGPFVSQYKEMLARLFPFSRGLTHAYWAPNVWAIYSFSDKVLSYAVGANNNSGTRGIVGDVAFAVLPEIKPSYTFYLALWYQLMACAFLFWKPTKRRALGCITLCAWVSYLVGWHVHEKAILLVIFPFSFFALDDRRLLSVFTPLVVAGYISLFPLLFTPAETLIKLLATFVWFVMILGTFNNLVKVSDQRRRLFYLDRLIFTYLCGYFPLLALTYMIPILLPSYEFLSLMLISVYCALGIVGSAFAFNWIYYFDDIVWN